MRYHSIKVLLWSTFAAASTFVLVSQFSPVSLGCLALTVAALSYWLVRHAEQLRSEYLSKENAASLPGPQDKLLWGSKLKPRVKDLAPGVVLIGLCCFYFAYEVAQGGVPSKLAKLGHVLFGTTGAVGAWCLAGVVLLAAGIESLIGSRAK